MVTRESLGLRQLLYGKRPHVYRVLYEVRKREKCVTVVHIPHGVMRDMEAR